MKRIYYLIIFLAINFGGLALGSWLMDSGPTSEWYLNLNKAPWTPPGWVFGAAWTLIMLCFSWYLSVLFHLRKSRFLWLLYLFQVLLNVSWNWIFFNQHLTNISLVVIILLTLVIFYYFITFRSDKLKNAKYLLLPYLIWLCIATSLNAYIVFNN
ncbi:tryptophan-rich sensory protein [Winogradskyella echinorum]|uniref:Tryptophan-rich sensory protein n=1 Tax=Winogradskyella echinorum TaxID=538189 RepID=A0ABR6Y1U3_9FLAO|nr:TspO/MBR family protein [Winogradskyella echinorum]MBC3846715.1 tryptophan-rich sensory protein [Winogradskyella echinorum]MBC5751063.1 tryptophan-rich sensory protein [Winogradskyella echinorum]